MVVGDEGLEESQDPAKKRTFSCGKVTAKVTSRAIQSELQVINAKWGSVPAATREAILHLIECTAE